MSTPWTKGPWKATFDEHETFGIEWERQMIFKDQLEAVYALIEKPENWTQNAYARDAGGSFIEDSEGDEIRHARHPTASCWCILGAGYKCGIEEKHMQAAIGAAANIFNDSHTHAEVLALLKSAIDRAPVRP